MHEQLSSAPLLPHLPNCSQPGTGSPEGFRQQWQPLGSPALRWLLRHNVAIQHKSDGGVAGSYFVKRRSSRGKWRDAAPRAHIKSCTKLRGLTCHGEKSPPFPHPQQAQAVPEDNTVLQASSWIPNILPDYQIRETQPLMSWPWASSSMGASPLPTQTPWADNLQNEAEASLLLTTPF